MSIRLVQSILAAEVLEFMDSLDAMTVVASDYLLLLKQTTPANVFINSKQLFDALDCRKRKEQRKATDDRYRECA